jgi:CRISPR-associated protein Cas1
MISRSVTLYERVAARRNLRRAWDLLNKRNPGSSGIDDVTIAYFQENLNKELSRIHDRLTARAYHFSPTKAVAKSKGEGKAPRTLRVPIVADRIVQKAILLQIQKLPSFRKFQRSQHSFAYIRGRSNKDLVPRVLELSSQFPWVLESDITRFFDSIKQDVLLRIVEPLLPDDSILPLLTSTLTAEIQFAPGMPRTIRSLFPVPGDGLPQGSAVSPFLSNVYLHQFDMSVVRRRWGLVRYADDFLVWAPTKSQARDAFEHCKDRLALLGLTLPSLEAHQKASRILPSSGGFDFVGFRFENGTAMPAAKAVSKLRARLSDILDPSSTRPLAGRLIDCARVLDGWSAAYPESVEVSRLLNDVCASAARQLNTLLVSKSLSTRHALSSKQLAFLRIAPARVLRTLR